VLIGGSVAGGLLLAGAVTACGNGGARAGDDLADRVIALLERNGPVDGDLEGADVRCPDVRAPADGDRATCEVSFGGSREVEVDVEFRADGSIVLVAVVPG
jgi:hypothetical protein